MDLLQYSLRNAVVEGVPASGEQPRQRAGGAVSIYSACANAMLFRARTIESKIRTRAHIGLTILAHHYCFPHIVILVQLETVSMIGTKRQPWIELVPGFAMLYIADPPANHRRRRFVDENGRLCIIPFRYFCSWDGLGRFRRQLST